ncbi:MAG TPA: DNA mismatch repair endonuclease MutL [Bacteroidia bacterium]|nr:DNA mismatch repair endonuclease MutL [Bacteroidia bacterium]
MSDIIRLLPDSVANQIAAGEVIQRPASAVKELIENAIDSGADQITVVVKDAGKSLIQVTDNGCGMSETDARMCFERHATSKINRAEDLFAIRTMGFRGEAMASIAAVAQVELKSRRHDQKTGTHLLIEGSKFVSQEPHAGNEGTGIYVKNLFYNIPARRNFLKSNASELRHIAEEFQRTAIARPDISFSLVSDGIQLFNLKPGNLRQRLTGIFGNAYNERLVPVEEQTTILGLNGFILKPEFAKKTRGEQYFFVNGRYIRDGYLNHAVVHAFENLLPPGTHPSYFLMIEMDPARIDINIHPTKTEIKFEDEKSVYAIMRAAVKRALGKFSIAPTLDFEQETAFNIPVSMYNTLPKQPSISINPSYNPFATGGSSTERIQVFPDQNREPRRQHAVPLFDTDSENETEKTIKVLSLLSNRFIVAVQNNDLLIIDPRAAHERVLYEKHLARLSNQPEKAQQQLFPQVLELSTADHLTMTECLEGMQRIGFDISSLGGTSYSINGLPHGINAIDVKPVVERILEYYRNSSGDVATTINESLARSTASAMAMRRGEITDTASADHLVKQLMQCVQPALTPNGKPVFYLLSVGAIENMFGV